MAKGTAVLRQAAMVLLNSVREQAAKREAIITSVHNRAGKLQDINPDDPTKVEIKPDVEEWILVSWELELNMLKKNIEELEKMFVEDEFDW